MTLEEIYNEDSTLRDYQRKSKLDIYKAWNLSSSVLFQMPTGTGKTRVFSSIIKDIQKISANEKRRIGVLVLAHREELIEQISESLGFKYHIAHGLIKSGFKPDDKFPVQVASVQTLNRRLNNYDADRFDYIIIDEAHHALAKTYKEICKKFPNAKLLGVTATPCRLGKGSLHTIFGTLVLSQSVSKFIEQGYLSSYRYYSISPTSSMQQKIDEIEDYAFDGDYSEKAMMEVCDTSKIRAGIVQAYLDYAKGKKGIIYTINQEHNKNICAEFEKIGISIAAIDSKTPSAKRKDIVSQFRSGKIDILCNVNIFSEGFDCPDVEFILLARPTCSLALYLQQVGRGLRPHAGKKDAIILDNVGSFNKFGLPSARRQWRRHFEGIDHLIKRSRREFSCGSYTTSDLSEGNEKLNLIYSSVEPETQLSDDKKLLDEVIRNKDLFPIGLYSAVQRVYFEGKSSPFRSSYTYSYSNELSWRNDVLQEIEELDCTFDDEYAEDYKRIISDYYALHRFSIDGKYGIYYDDGQISRHIKDIAAGVDDIHNYIQIVLEPIYDELGIPDTNDDCICRKYGKYGVIEGTSMKEIIPFEYEELYPTGYRRYMCQKDGKYGIITNEVVVLEPEFDDGFMAYDRSCFTSISYFIGYRNSQYRVFRLDNSTYKYVGNKFKILGELSKDVYVCAISKDLLGICNSDGRLLAGYLFHYIHKVDWNEEDTYVVSLGSGLYTMSAEFSLNNSLSNEDYEKAALSFDHNYFESKYNKSRRPRKKKSPSVTIQESDTSKITVEPNDETVRNDTTEGSQQEIEVKTNPKDDYVLVKVLHKNYSLVRRGEKYTLLNTKSNKLISDFEYDSIENDPHLGGFIFTKDQIKSIFSIKHKKIVGLRYGDISIVHKNGEDKLLYKNRLVTHDIEISHIKDDIYKTKNSEEKWGIIRIKQKDFSCIKPNVYTRIEFSPETGIISLYQVNKRARILKISDL